MKNINRTNPKRLKDPRHLTRHSKNGLNPLRVGDESVYKKRRDKREKGEEDPMVNVQTIMSRTITEYPITLRQVINVKMEKCLP